MGLVHCILYSVCACADECMCVCEIKCACACCLKSKGAMSRPGAWLLVSSVFVFCFFNYYFWLSSRLNSVCVAGGEPGGDSLGGGGV